MRQKSQKARVSPSFYKMDEFLEKPQGWVKLIPPEGFLGLSVVNPRKGSVKELIQPMAAKTRSPVILTYFESITDA